MWLEYKGRMCVCIHTYAYICTHYTYKYIYITLLPIIVGPLRIETNYVPHNVNTKYRHKCPLFPIAYIYNMDGILNHLVQHHGISRVTSKGQTKLETRTVLHSFVLYF